MKTVDRKNSMPRISQDEHRVSIETASDGVDFPPEVANRFYDNHLNVQTLVSAEVSPEPVERTVDTPMSISSPIPNIRAHEEEDSKSLDEK